MLLFNGYLLAVFAQYLKALLPWKIGIWLLVFFTVGWWFDLLVCVCDQSIYSWYSWTYRWWTIFQYVRQNLWIIKQPIDPPGSASLRLRDFAAELFAAFEAKVPGRRLITCALGKRGNLVFFHGEMTQLMAISWGCKGCQFILWG